MRMAMGFPGLERYFKVKSVGCIKLKMQAQSLGSAKTLQGQQSHRMSPSDGVELYFLAVCRRKRVRFLRVGSAVKFG